MSVYTTLEITREDAIELILKRVLSADNECLERMAFEAWGVENNYNFNIVSEYDENDSYRDYRRHK